MKSRSSHPYVFCKKSVPKNFAKFTGKYLCQSLFFNKFLTLSKKRLWHRYFPVNFPKYLGTTFFTEHLWWLLLEIFMDEPCQKKPMQIIWGGQTQLIQNEFLCCDNRCISSARLRKILRTLGTTQLPTGTAGIFPSTLSYHRFCVPNWVCKRPGAFSHDEDMKKSAVGLQGTVSPPSRSWAEPWRGTKRRSTRKLSVFGLWESHTLA